VNLTPGVQIVSIEHIKVGERCRKDVGDLEGLAASIRDVGLLHPIGIKCDGTLIYGGRRLAAAKLNGDAEIMANVLDLSDGVRQENDENELRKDLLPSEKAAIAKALKAKYGDRRKVSGETRDPGNCPDRKEIPKGKETRQVIAVQAGFSSTREMERVEKVVNQGTEELIDAMDKGEISPSGAAKVAEAPPAKQRAAVEKVKAGKSRTASNGRATAKSLESASKEAHDWFGKLIRYADKIVAGRVEFESMRKAFQDRLQKAKDQLVALEMACK
jgi:hypothetical protein